MLEEHMEIRSELRKIKDPPRRHRVRKSKGKDPIIPICPNSDEHYDEEFTLASTNNVNFQTPEYAEQKAENYSDRLIGLMERDALDNPLPVAHLPFMGDMIAGALHPKDERVSSMTPLEASRFAYRIKRNLIDKLLAKGPAEKLVISCVDGNHGRSTAKRTPGLNQRYSYEHEIYLRLAEWYREKGEDRVEFYIPQSDFAVVPITNTFSICITHGDSVRGGSGIGGLAPPLLRAVSRWQQAYPADLYLLGHFHQYWDLGTVAVNPSAVGYNPYAASLGLPPQPPAQLYTALHTGRNMRAMTAPIWVT